MTTNVLFDTSAYLAIINAEPGSYIAQQHIANASMSTVNIAEVVTFLTRNGYDDTDKIRRIVNLVRPITYSKDIAIESGRLVMYTKTLGLSLGDRACLATAIAFKLTVYTADKKWSKLANKLNLDIIQIR